MKHYEMKGKSFLKLEEHNTFMKKIKHTSFQHVQQQQFAIYLP